MAVALNDDSTIKSSVIQTGTVATVLYSNGVFTIAYISHAAQFNMTKPQPPVPRAPKPQEPRGPDDDYPSQ